MTKGRSNRVKGHSLERQLAQKMRDIGFAHCKTSRAESKTLDNCGVDLANVPYLLQAKSGYDNRYPRYPEIRKYIKAKLSENYEKTHPVHGLPVILVHKPTNAVTYYSFDEDTALELMFVKQNLNEILKDCLEMLLEAMREIVTLEETILAVNDESEDSFDEVETILPNNQVYDKLEDLSSRLKLLLKT